MTKQKHILCCLNLSLFLVSFLLFIAGAFMTSSGELSFDLKHKQLVSKQTMHEEGSQQLSENNETENEADDEVQLLEFTLPFFITHAEQVISYVPTQYASPLAKLTATPIYVSVGNFRI